MSYSKLSAEKRGYPYDTLFPEYQIDRSALLLASPKTVPIIGTKYHMLIEEFEYEEGHWIPYGFVFDGASIPRPARALFYSPYDGRIMAQAVGHDWGYYTHWRSRKDEDEYFYEECKRTMNGFLAKSAHLAVKVGGSRGWKNEPGDIAHMVELELIRRAQNSRWASNQNFDFPPEVIERADKINMLPSE